jgi:hypothetical protein
MRFLIAVLLLAAATMVSPGELEAQGHVGKIAVAGSGAVSYDGAPVSLEALKTKLADLKSRNGVVWYYREYTAQEPPAAASAVVKLIIEQQLPVSMSTKPDYSDVIMPDGTTNPRSR